MYPENVSDSEFYMWRALFSFALADKVLSLEKQGLLQSYRAGVPFSRRQLTILRADFKTPQNAAEMYRRISEPEHRMLFCVLARALIGQAGRDEVLLKNISAGDDMRYRRYEQAGLAGLPKTPPIIEIRA